MTDSPKQSAQQLIEKEKTIEIDLLDKNPSNVYEERSIKEKNTNEMIQQPTVVSTVEINDNNLDTLTPVSSTKSTPTPIIEKKDYEALRSPSNIYPSSYPDCCCYNNCRCCLPTCIRLKCIPKVDRWIDYSDQTTITKWSFCRLIWIGIGWISFIVGMIGIFLPVLPTTPFLLVSAYCWARGSIMFYNWLMNHPIFGQLILTFVKYRVIPLRAKIMATTLICLTIPLSAIFAIPDRLIYAKITMGVIGFCTLCYIWHFPSKKPSEDEENSNEINV